MTSWVSGTLSFFVDFFSDTFVQVLNWLKDRQRISLIKLWQGFQLNVLVFEVVEVESVVYFLKDFFDSDRENFVEGKKEVERYEIQ